MKNIELKIFVDDFNEIKKLLKRIRARHIGEMFQKDTYYKCEAGRMKIRSIDNKKFELIFYKRPNKANGKISNYEIFNIKPNQVDCIRSLMEKCFKKQVVVEKKRDLWIYKKTRVHLDRVAKLGNFLELETVAGKSLKNAKTEFKKLFDLLNLKKYKKYTHSYSDLLLKKDDHS